MASDDRTDFHKQKTDLENSQDFRYKHKSDSAVTGVTIDRKFVVQDGKKIPVKNDFNGKRGNVSNFEESTRLFTIQFNEASAGYGNRGSFQLWDLKWDPGAAAPTDQAVQTQKDNVQRYGQRMEQEFMQLVRQAHPNEVANATPYPRSINQINKDGNAKNIVRFLQFNILAHGLSGVGGGFAILYAKDAPDDGKSGNIDTMEKFGTPAREKNGLMDWDVRKIRLLADMCQYAPDVMCIEELDHYHDWLQPELKKLGYESSFWMKAKSAATRGKGVANNGGYRDGAGIFWNTVRFEQLGVSRKFILLDQNGKPCKQVGLYVVLRNKQTQRIFAVVCSHHKSGDKEKDRPTKAAQTRYVADMITREIGEIPVIFSSDLNTNPSTPAYQEWEKYAQNMRSSYQVANSNRHPPYTTSKWRKGGDQPDKLGRTTQTIDFIFYSDTQWEVKSTLSIPAQSDLEELLMPGWRYPSDHFSILADLELL